MQINDIVDNHQKLAMDTLPNPRDLALQIACQESAEAVLRQPWLVQGRHLPWPSLTCLCTHSPSYMFGEPHDETDKDD